MSQAAEDAATDRPAATPEAALARLDALGIRYTLHRHPPLFTVEESKALRGTMPGGHTKNLFLRDKAGRMFLVTAEEDRRIDLKALQAPLGAGRLSFGSAERLMGALGIRPGAVSPIALMNDGTGVVRAAIDSRLLELSPVNVHPLTNDMTIAVAPSDLLRFMRDTGHEPLVLDLDRLATG